MPLPTIYFVLKLMFLSKKRIKNNNMVTTLLSGLLFPRLKKASKVSKHIFLNIGITCPQIVNYFGPHGAMYGYVLELAITLPLLA